MREITRIKIENKPPFTFAVEFSSAFEEKNSGSSLPNLTIPYWLYLEIPSVLFDFCFLR